MLASIRKNSKHDKPANREIFGIINRSLKTQKKLRRKANKPFFRGWINLCRASLAFDDNIVLLRLLKNQVKKLLSSQRFLKQPSRSPLRFDDRSTKSTSG